MIKKIEKRIKYVRVAELKHFKDNPRKNNASAKIVAKSIEEFGYICPIIVDEENVVLAGNTRLKALKLLGVEEIDVIEVIGLTEDQKTNFVLADNRVNEYSRWNWEQVNRLAEKQEAAGQSSILGDLGMRSRAHHLKELEEKLK